MLTHFFLCAGREELRDGSPIGTVPMFTRLDPKFRSYWGNITSLGTASWERWLDCDRCVCGVLAGSLLRAALVAPPSPSPANIKLCRMFAFALRFALVDVDFVFTSVPSVRTKCHFSFLILRGPSFSLFRFALVMEPDFKPAYGKSFTTKFNLNPQYKIANAAVCAHTRDKWCSMVLIDNHTYVRFVNPVTLRAQLNLSAADEQVVSRIFTGFASFILSSSRISQTCSTPESAVSIHSLVAVPGFTYTRRLMTLTVLGIFHHRRTTGQRRARSRRPLGSACCGCAGRVRACWWCAWVSSAARCG